MRPEVKTLGRTLAARVASQGGHEAYVGPGERLTWHDVLQGAREIARALHASGVRRGDHVGLLLGNSGLWIQAFYGCALVGAVTVPVNTRFKPEELAFCLRQSDVRLLLCADSFLGIDFAAMLRAVEPAVATALPGAALPCLQTVVSIGDAPPAAGAVAMRDFIARGSTVDDATLESLADAVQVDDVLLIQYTSGTTSFPKGVMLSHANMLLDAQEAGRRIGIGPQDRYFSIRPFFHVAGSTLSILASLTWGCCLLSLPRFDVAQNLRVLDEERCTLISGNDTIFLMLMGHPEFDRRRLHLRGGWAAAGPEVMQQIHDLMGATQICNAYGQSEASPNVLMTPSDDPLALRVAGWGLPLPGVDVRIADAETAAVLPAGTQGEIQVRGWNVMRGYYRMEEATAKAFTADGWLKTGDLGEASADGRFRMVGRLKDMYRVGGENVAPAEIEEILHAHPAVQQAQVVGVPDARLGEVTGAFVILKAGQSAGTDELVQWCRDRCANFKVPRYLDVVDSFEHIGMTGSSKVQKNKLRAHAIERWQLADLRTGTTR